MAAFEGSSSRSTAAPQIPGDIKLLRQLLSSFFVQNLPGQNLGPSPASSGGAASLIGLLTGQAPPAALTRGTLQFPTEVDQGVQDAGDPRAAFFRAQTKEAQLRGQEVSARVDQLIEQINQGTGPKIINRKQLGIKNATDEQLARIRAARGGLFS